jgi:hypothetical protein
MGPFAEKYQFVLKRFRLISISPKVRVLCEPACSAAQIHCANGNNPERHYNMADHSTISGRAALSICEALLLALNDAKILPESEIMGVLKDAATTHGLTGGSDAEIESHKAVSALINKIIDGGNSVRRT